MPVLGFCHSHPSMGSKPSSKFHSCHASVSTRRLGKASHSSCTPSIRLQSSEQFKCHSKFQVVAFKSAFSLDSIIRIFRLSITPKPGIQTFSCSNFQILKFLQNFQILNSTNSWFKQNFQILSFHPNLVPLQGLWGVTAQAHQRERLDGPFQ